jgi:hypothetical protein
MEWGDNGIQGHSSQQLTRVPHRRFQRAQAIPHAMDVLDSQKHQLGVGIPCNSFGFQELCFPVSLLANVHRDLGQSGRIGRGRCMHTPSATFHIVALAAP